MAATCLVPVRSPNVVLWVYIWPIIDREVSLVARGLFLAEGGGALTTIQLQTMGCRARSAEAFRKSDSGEGRVTETLRPESGVCESCGTGIGRDFWMAIKIPFWNSWGLPELNYRTLSTIT